MASKIDVEVSNLAAPVLSVQISDYIEFATKSFVTESISSHNISPISHEDIRTFISELSADINTLYLSAGSIVIDYTNLFNELSNNLSGYATLSGSTFYGDIYATNLTGINTGDQDLTYLENDIEELSGNVENLNILVDEISGNIPDLTPYALQTFVTGSISEHNIDLNSHQDIRTSITDVNNSLSAYSTISFVTSAISSIPNPDMSQYAPITGATFTGDIYATNLTGINTGDQDLSSYALTSTVNIIYNSLSAYALETFVTSSISSHNIDLTAHSNILSSYALESFVTSSISSLSAENLSALNNKIDKVYSATSGNFPIFNASGNIIDSNLPLSSYLILDDLGQINQMKYMPTVYLKNKTPSLSEYCHEVWLETNIENDDIMLVIGDPVLIQDLINPPVTYTLEYFGNGNDLGNVPVDLNSPYVSGSSVTVLGNTGNLIKYGYIFNDWNTLSGGTGTNYSSGSTFTVNFNTNLFAKWAINPKTWYFTGAGEYGAWEELDSWSANIDGTGAHPTVVPWREGYLDYNLAYATGVSREVYIPDMYSTNITGFCLLNVNSDYSIMNSGNFVGNFVNYGNIYGGTFIGNVENYNTIEGGIFTGNVINNSDIVSGTFNGFVNNSASIYGGIFNAQTRAETTGTIAPYPDTIFVGE